MLIDTFDVSYMESYIYIYILTISFVSIYLVSINNLQYLQSICLCKVQTYRFSTPLYRVMIVRFISQIWKRKHMRMERR